MKLQIILIIGLICLSQCRRHKKSRSKYYVPGMHYRHPYTDGAAIGPKKIKVYKDQPLASAPGAEMHETQYWHETNEIKKNTPEAYYHGGEEGAVALPHYSVSYGLGGQRKALTPRVRGLRYYSRFNKKHQTKSQQSIQM